LRPQKGGHRQWLDSPPPPGATASWLTAFVLLQIGCQVALLFDTWAGYRVVFRSAAFLLSLALLVLLPPRGRSHPARPWALAILGVLALSFVHPDTYYSPLAATAQAAMYVAILAPIFWVGRLQITSKTVTRLFLLLWGFHTLSALVGVLQLYYPGQFQPALSSTLRAYGPAYTVGLKVTLANGQEVWRPMGLTDVPGGAGVSGLSALLLGIGLLFSSRSRLARGAALASMAAGLFCIYLSMTRVALVLAGVGVIAASLVFWARGEVKRAVTVLATASFIGLASLAWALSVGGDSVATRLSTLVEDRPDAVYYRNRGLFLEYTFTELLPRYPMGAGMGRWGMMNYYFGDRDAPPLDNAGVEIQWTAWLLDGGVPLMLCYGLAMLVTARTAWRLATDPAKAPLSVWAAVLVARDIGAIAITFSYPIFISQAGMEFWWCNACLYCAFVKSRQERREQLAAQQRTCYLTPAGLPGR
jgi:hypothetical protein